MDSKKVTAPDVKTIKASEVVDSHYIVEQGIDGALYAYPIRSISVARSGTVTIQFGRVGSAAMTRNPDDLANVLQS